MAKNIEKAIQISDSDSIDLEVTSSESVSLELEDPSPEPALPKPQKKSGVFKNPKSTASSSDPAKSSAGKRRAAEMEPEPNVEEGQQKNKQKVVETEEKEVTESSKKNQSKRRRWSEKDEIVILKGMIVYAEKRKSEGKLPTMKGLFDYVKERLDGDVTLAQLNPKIRRMRERFETVKGNEEDGVETVFANSHELRAYQLSKEVWGTGDGRFFGGPKGRRENAAAKPDQKDAIEEESEKEEENEEEKKQQQMIADGKKEWRKLKIQEMEIHLQKLELMQLRTKLVLEALKAAMDP